MPKMIENKDFYYIKAMYIENNPVRKEYVREPKDWVYSSANKLDNFLVLENFL